MAPSGKAGSSSQLSHWPDGRVNRETLGNEADVPTEVQVKKCSKSHCCIKSPRWVLCRVHHHTVKGPLRPLQHLPTATDIPWSGWAHPLFHSTSPSGWLLLVIRPQLGQSLLQEAFLVPFYTGLAALPLCLHCHGIASLVARIPEGCHCLLISLSFLLGFKFEGRDPMVRS